MLKYIKGEIDLCGSFLILEYLEDVYGDVTDGDVNNCKNMLPVFFIRGAD